MNKRWLLLILVVVLSLSALWWIYSNAVIEVSVENPGDGKISYSFLNQGDQKNTQVAIDGSSVSKRVKRGNYEITVAQGGASYFAVVKANGFLSKTRITATLATEQHRHFVGDNPSTCAHYGDMLYSYDCNGFIAQLTKHVPATAALPTYTKRVPTKLEGITEGFVVSNAGTVAVVHPIDVEGGGEHVAYTLNDKLEPTNFFELKGASLDSDYTATLFKSGVLLSNRKYDEFLHYKSLGAEPEKIPLQNPDDKELIPALAGNDRSSVAVLYSSAGATANPQKPSDTKNVVAVYSGSKQTNINYDGHEVTDLKPCADNYVCVLNDKSILDIYDLSATNPKHMYSLLGVKAMGNSDKGLLIINSKGVLNFSPSLGSGYYELTTDGYVFDSIIIGTNSYVLGLVDNSKRKVALRIDQSKQNTDSIDKKVAELQKTPGVSFVSIYGKFIYVSAELGSLVYDNSTSSYVYDPETQKAVSAKINSEIDGLGIDRKEYTITSNAF